jgi:KaiC/GvpD/RAD55 family RecA-like ATPase
MAFVKATKTQARLRMALHGPSGAGKTWTGLAIAANLVPGGRVAVVDTERGSASKYAHRFAFDVDEISGDYHPDKLIKAIGEAASAGYDVLLVDSISLFWNGPGGLLELVDAEVARARARGGKADSFAAWKVVDPIYRRMVQTILAAPIHCIMTMRAKQEYVKEQGDNGRTTIRKVGLAPEMRDAFQYEADVEGMLDLEHNLVIGKTRCEALDGRLFAKPGKDVADILHAWLSDGAEAPAPREPEPTPWLTELLESFASAATEADLKAAQAQAQARKAELNANAGLRDAVIAAGKAAKARLAEQATAAE